MNRRELLVAIGGLLPLRHADFGWRIQSANQSATRGPRTAIVFDAYGTLFDVHSVVTLANELFPGQGDALSQRWRAKQLEYSWTLSLMRRYEDFWDVTGHALTFACHALKLSCNPSEHRRLETGAISATGRPFRSTTYATPASRTRSTISPKFLAASVADTLVVERRRRLLK